MHARHDSRRNPSLANNLYAYRGADPGRPRRQSLQVHGVRRHRRGCETRVGAHYGAASAMRAFVPDYEMITPGTLAQGLRMLKDEPGVWKPFAGGTDLMV